LHFNENSAGGLPELGEVDAVSPPLSGLISALKGHDELELAII